MERGVRGEFLPGPGTHNYIVVMWRELAMRTLATFLGVFLGVLAAWYVQGALLLQWLP